MKIPIREKKHFALIGYPLGHSISPFIHSELSKLSAVIIDYDLIEIEKEKLNDAFENELKELDGFNVTIPYKSEIIPLLDGLSTRAEIFQSVNTVFFENGRSTGFNTDCIGFLRSLADAEINIEGRVLILGCGGVARTFITECIMAGAEITLGIRPSSLEKANALCDEIKARLNASVKPVFIDKIEGGFDLIINATPVGMYPLVDACPVSEAVVKSSKAVFDAVYNPLETKLIKIAKENGVKHLNGLPMLVWQAAAAEEIWNDLEFEKEEIDYVIRQAEEYLKNE